MSPEEMVEALRSARTAVGRGPRAEKMRLLRELSREPITTARLLRGYHDLLLFLAAYPDSAAMLKVVEGELKRLASIVKERPGLAARLVDTGIANTEIVHPFTLDMTRWLVGRLGADVELDWDDGSLGEAMDEFLHALVPTVERDGLYADHLTTQEWFALAKGSRRASDAGWLVEQFGRLEGPASLRDHAFDSLSVAVRWRLRAAGFSRPTARFPRRPIFYQEEPILRQIDLRSLVAKRLGPPKYLARRRAEEVLDACRTTLCVRHREIDTLTYANPGEVALYRLERGIDVAVFGMTPERRLPIESYFGFIVARNRVPMGYGGGWVFFERCEIGVNIFDEFRGGESAFAFAQVIRVYKWLFGATRFCVDPFQFGAGNREAIHSGAFWFYYRLGFRPIDAKLRALADEEAGKLRASPRHRTSAPMLRKLARAKLGLSFDEADDQLPELDLTKLGLALTAEIGKRFRGDRRRAEEESAVDVMRMLKTGSMKKWPAEERDAFRRLALMVHPLKAVARWPRPAKDKLLKAMRAKGGPRERDYATRLQRIPELRSALAQLAGAAPEGSNSISSS